jgi:hypothetical protein
VRGCWGLVPLSAVEAVVDDEPSGAAVVALHGLVLWSAWTFVGGGVFDQVADRDDVKAHAARSPLAWSVRRNAPSARSASGHAFWMADQMAEARKARAARRVMMCMASPVLRRLLCAHINAAFVGTYVTLRY